MRQHASTCVAVRVVKRHRPLVLLWLPCCVAFPCWILLDLGARLSSRLRADRVPTVCHVCHVCRSGHDRTGQCMPTTLWAGLGHSRLSSRLSTTGASVSRDQPSVTRVTRARRARRARARRHRISRPGAHVLTCRTTGQDHSAQGLQGLQGLQDIQCTRGASLAALAALAAGRLDRLDRLDRFGK